MAKIKPLVWTSIGNDWVRDGLTGRLGSPELFGETMISGATNCVAINEAENGVTTLYAGSVNGGVHSRNYDRTTGRWEEQWSWVSKPGSGYTGAQSISALAISEDGKYLAVGQGNPSNYARVGTPSEGIQIGKIGKNGKIDWVKTTDDAKAALIGLKIRSLQWQGSSIIATSWDRDNNVPGQLLKLDLENGIINKTDAIMSSIDNFIVEDLPTASIAIAGHTLSALPINTIGAIDPTGNLSTLTGAKYAEYTNELNSNEARIARASAHPSLVNGRIIMFVGSYKITADQEQEYIYRIDRLSINPDSLELEEFSSILPEKGTIGNNQASNDLYFGNFSLKADSYDPLGMSVYAGGNHYGASPKATGLTYGGGLVRLDFDPATTEEISYLYGPRVENGSFHTPPSPGQPHADSRSVDFYTSAEGPALIQTDDGGIWHINLEQGANGSKLDPQTWWKSLTATGLNTLEVNMVDWGSSANTIATSYQDNAASLGYYGDSFATNLWMGDGQIAVIDDGSDEDKATGYLSSYHYLAGGDIQKYDYDSQGFIKGMEYTSFYLKPTNQFHLKPSSRSQAVPWNYTPESVYYNNGNPIPFLLPFEDNAYRTDSLVMAGRVNAYESVDVRSNQIVFRPLLKEDNPLGIFFTALDNQGSSKQGAITSLYLASENNKQEIEVYGRQSRASGTDEHAFISPIRFNNLDSRQISLAGPVNDIAHKRNITDNDTLYILQGGKDLTFFGINSTPARSQLLRVGQNGSDLKTFSLDELGITTVDGDQYGLQSVVYVPANRYHQEKLVVSGLSGVWISELDHNGLPTGFEPMNWEGLPQQTPPGSYLKEIKYEPKDDLLILGTQGKGNWIYSFTGDLGNRPKPSQLLHVSNITLPQQTKADVDKRGNQVNQTIAIQLDSRLQNKQEPTQIQILLHQPKKWRKFMDVVSPYHVTVDSNINDSAREQANQWLNILDPIGLEYRGGIETKDSIIMPFEFDPGVSMFNLTVNPREFPKPNPAKLRYTVRIADGTESVSRTLSLVTDSFTPKYSSDPITGLKLSGKSSRLLSSANNQLNDASQRFNMESENLTIMQANQSLTDPQHSNQLVDFSSGINMWSQRQDPGLPSLDLL